MIIGGKITGVEAKRTKEGEIKGLNINMAIDTVRVKGTEVEVDYTYTVKYNEEVGIMAIKGTILAQEDKGLAKEIETTWTKTKRLPEDYAEIVLNSINYTGTANGTLVARVLNLSPPLVPPRIEIDRSAKK